MSGSSCGFGDGFAKPSAELELLLMGDALAETLDGGILIGFDGDVGADDEDDVLT